MHSPIFHSATATGRRAAPAPSRSVRLTPVAAAFLAAWAALGTSLTSAQQAKDTQTVTISGERDKRDMPLEQPTGTGSRLGLSIRETPASVDVLSQEVMQERGETAPWSKPWARYLA
jgi:outer membrane receptor for ferric coprogen and ferric-rhodotorulic acid